MKLGLQVGLGPGHTVRRGPSSPPSKGHNPQFLVHICCGQMAGWIKIPLGTEVGLGQAIYVRWGPRCLPKKGRSPLQIFCPCLLWLNGWLDQDGTWHGGRPQPRRRCVRWGPSPSPKRGQSPLPNFRPISIVAKQLDASRCHLVWR